MMNRILHKASTVIQARPSWFAIALAVIAVFSVWRVQDLHINYNQFDALPPELPSVEATREMMELLGGVGHFIIATKSDDLDHLKEVVEDLAEPLRKLPEVRSVVYKQDVDFVRDRVAYFVKTEDLKEAYKRIRKKIRAILRKQNPFAIELVKTKDEPLDLSDIVEKYKRINKKGIDDPYYIDKKGEMILLIVKPRGNPHDLDFVRDLVGKLDAIIADYNQNNTRNATLKEHYKGFAPNATVTYGYTGSYKTNLDDSDSIRAALAPTSMVAFLGILFYLVLFLRRTTQIVLIMGMLVISVTMTFAFARVTIGELNTVTALLGAILMGLGIDFGIHFVYRLREEYTRTRSLRDSIHETIVHSGRAAAISASTIAAALFILTISTFSGFSDFGIIAGAGVIMTAIVMYVGIPVAYLLLTPRFPGLERALIMAPKSKTSTSQKTGMPYARAILGVSTLMTAVFAYFAWQIRFDFDGRSLMTTDRPSILLKEEINERYAISADPAGIYTTNLKDTRELYEAFRELPEDTTIDEVISIFTIVPDAEQQQANRKILDKLKRKMDQIDPEALPEKERKVFEAARPFLEAPMYSLEDVPPHIAQQFKPVADAKKPGYLTFFYPRISVWDGEALIRFADEVGTVELEDRTVRAAGMAVLYADLAEVVIADGQSFTLFAAVAIFFVILLTFRSLRAVWFAMLPLTAGMVWMLGLMAASGWRINFMNIVVLPVVFGYGISSGIHLYHRYLESHSVMTAFRQTGSAVVASSITTLVGWVALLVSEHRGLNSMGILATFGIAGGLAISLTVLPAMLQVFPETFGGRQTEPDSAAPAEDSGETRKSA